MCVNQRLHTHVNKFHLFLVKSSPPVCLHPFPPTCTYHHNVINFEKRAHERLTMLDSQTPCHRQVGPSATFLIPQLCVINSFLVNAYFPMSSHFGAPPSLGTRLFPDLNLANWYWGTRNAAFPRILLSLCA